MRSLFGIVGIVSVIVIGVLAALSVFVVDLRQQAIVLQFGNPVRVIEDPGLKFKVPIVQDVVFIERRILDLDSPVQEVIAADQRRLVVDTFARYRITNALTFYQAFNNIDRANSQLANILNSSTRRVLGEATFEQIVRDDRPRLMESIREQMNQEARANDGQRGFGIEVLDVRIRRADLPEANSQAIYQRMETERQQEAAEIRAQGEELARRIRSRADRDVTVVVAEAERESQQIRGEGDAERNAIFADAFGRNPEFFAFYRSMQAYEAGLQAQDTRLVISPDSDFFRYFQDPMGLTHEARRLERDAAIAAAAQEGAAVQVPATDLPETAVLPAPGDEAGDQAAVPSTPPLIPALPTAAQ